MLEKSHPVIDEIYHKVRKAEYESLRRNPSGGAKVAIYVDEDLWRKALAEAKGALSLTYYEAYHTQTLLGYPINIVRNPCTNQITTHRHGIRVFSGGGY